MPIPPSARPAALLLGALAALALAAAAPSYARAPAIAAEVAEPPRWAPVVVRGTVFGPDGPLADVTVSIASVAARTDGRGAYALTVNAERGDTLLLRALRVGWTAHERALVVGGDTIVAHLTLRASETRLSEVVVTSTAADAASEARVERQRVGSAAAAAPPPPPAAPAQMLQGRVAGVAAGAAFGGRPVRDPGAWNTEEYAPIAERGFVAVRSDPLSTFAIDVDRASYGNVRRFLREGRLPPADAVRVEELVNYFAYDYAAPSGRHPVAVTTEVTAAPWAPAHRLVRVGLRAPDVDVRDLPPANLVFLVDVSGSMDTPNKLPLVQRSLRLLVDELRGQDRVSIVVYAGAAGLVLPPTSAADRGTIMRAIDDLEAGGSTAGGAGIQLAYDVARRSHRPGMNTRVVLATDGDFNVGTSSTSELVRLVERRREEGTFLTVLGFGMGNYKDGRLEQLADRGNGNYAYIDDLLEARKVLVRELGATLLTVAKDVKLQVEFNPARVRAWRLVGYENRALADEDFANDAKDAGEMGAGHTVTALYEIVPVGARTDAEIHEVPALRYQDRAPTGRADADELLAVSLRYKPPTGSESRLLRHVVHDRVRSPSADMAFASAVAGFGLLLRESPYRGALTWRMVESLARPGLQDDPDGDRAGFLELVRVAHRLQRGEEDVAGRDGR